MPSRLLSLMAGRLLAQIHDELLCFKRKREH